MARGDDLRRTPRDTGPGNGARQDGTQPAGARLLVARPDDPRPPLTAEAVAEAQRLLGVTLPAALLDLLRHRDGGEVADDRNAFPTDRPTSWSADHVPFDWLLGIGRHPWALTLLDSPYLVAEWGLPTPVVLLSGEGPCWIGLDYRDGGRDGEPSVTWFEADLGREVPLAPDFRSFLDGLTAADDFV